MHLAPEPTSAWRFLKHRTGRVTTGVVLAHAGLIWLIATGLLSTAVPGGETEHLIMANVITDAPAAPATPAPLPQAQPKSLPLPRTPTPPLTPTLTPTPVASSAAPTAAAPTVPAPSAAPAAAAPTGNQRPGTASATPAPVVLPSSDADYLNNPAPVYPGMSRRMGEQGTAVLRVFINTEGRAEKAEIRSSSGYSRLDEAALATVQRWRYVPGKRAGVPEAMWFNVPIRFVLD
ncbi:MAG: energy transducer TonB [Limnohabitans sp.]